MHVLLYHFALASMFALGMTTLMQPHRHTREYMQTLRDVELAGVEYIAQNCNALPGAVTHMQLQALGNLPAGFDNQDAVFTLNLARHPAINWNVSGNAEYLAFLATRTTGVFETDGTYSFLPAHDVTFFRAANSSYNLFAYAENDFSCTPL